MSDIQVSTQRRELAINLFSALFMTILIQSSCNALPRFLPRIRYFGIMSNLAAVKGIRKLRLDQIIRSHRHPLRHQTQPRVSRTSANVPVASPSEQLILPNPFVAHKMSNGKWRAPIYSLRKQAELVRVAKANGLLHLLPPGPKNPLPRLPRKDQDSQAALALKEAEENKATRDLRQRLPEKGQNWLQPITWRGKVKDRTPKPGITLYTGRKRMFKGHKWERLQEHRKKKQAILMRDMKKRVYNFKMVSHSLW